MSIVDKVKRFNDFVQSSLDNGMNAVKTMHQTAVEIPIDIGKELGLPADKADILKATHRRILDNTYSGARSAQIELGSLVVQQIGEVSTLIKDLAAAGGRGSQSSTPATDAGKSVGRKKKSSRGGKTAAPISPGSGA
jgi:hypothetical protein